MVPVLALLAVGGALLLFAGDASAQWWNQPELLSPEPWSQTTVHNDVVTLTGYGHPGNMVYATADGTDGPLMMQTTVGHYGDWSVDVPLAHGENEITVYLYGKGMMPYDIVWVTREDGNPGRGSDRTPVLLSPAPDSQSSTLDWTVVVSGYGSPGDSVHIAVEHSDFNIPAVEAVTGQDLEWSAYVPLGGGDNLVRVYTDGYDPDPDGTDWFSPHERFFVYRDRGCQLLDVVEVSAVTQHHPGFGQIVMGVGNVPEGATVCDISLNVQVTGAPDLSGVTTYLVAPNGTKVTLPTVHKLFTTTNAPVLQGLIGHGAAGDWRFETDSGTASGTLDLAVDLNIGVRAEYLVDEHLESWQDTALARDQAVKFEMDVSAGENSVVTGLSVAGFVSGQIEDDDISMWLTAPDGSSSVFKSFGQGTNNENFPFAYTSTYSALGQLLGKSAAGKWELNVNNRGNGGMIDSIALAVKAGTNMPDHARDVVPVRGLVHKQVGLEWTEGVATFDVHGSGTVEDVALRITGKDASGTDAPQAAVYLYSAGGKNALCYLDLDGTNYAVTDCPLLDRLAGDRMDGTWAITALSQAGSPITISDLVLEITTSKPAPPPVTTTATGAGAWPVTVQPAPPLAYSSIPEMPGVAPDWSYSDIQVALQDLDGRP